MRFPQLRHLARGFLFIAAAAPVAACGVETGNAHEATARFSDGTPIPSPGTP